MEKLFLQSQYSDSMLTTGMKIANDKLDCGCGSISLWFVLIFRLQFEEKQKSGIRVKSSNIPLICVMFSYFIISLHFFVSLT